MSRPPVARKVGGNCCLRAMQASKLEAPTNLSKFLPSYSSLFRVARSNCSAIFPRISAVARSQIGAILFKRWHLVMTQLDDGEPVQKKMQLLSYFCSAAAPLHLKPAAKMRCPEPWHHSWEAEFHSGVAGCCNSLHMGTRQAAGKTVRNMCFQ